MKKISNKKPSCSEETVFRYSLVTVIMT